MNTAPVILSIGGHDPTGGAGIQADIETITALGARATTLVTTLTTQDSHNIYAIEAVAPEPFEARLRKLTRDIPPHAVKIGMIGSVGLIPVLQQLISDSGVPLVLDPVLAAGGGFDIGNAGLAGGILDCLVPLSTLITPNRAEARRLTGSDDAEHAAQLLLESGAGAVLLTGADEAEGRRVINLLFQRGQPVRSFDWPRLPHGYHGSGCTLASACVTRLALGDDPVAAVAAAQEFTWQALRQADRPGSGQWLPGRRA